MKKFILFIVALFTVFVAQAQLATVQLQLPQTYVAIETDYTVTNTTAGYMLFKAEKHQPATQDYVCHLDSTSGDHTNVAVVLSARKFPETSFTTISTVNWKGTTSDTTIVISNATANRYRDYKVTLTGTGTGVTTLAWQRFKLYLE